MSAQIEAIKAEQGLDNLVLTGSIPKENMPAMLRTCDILLAHLAKVPVLYTGSPNKLFDALSTGRPIIVNSPGWTRPLVVDNDAGCSWSLRMPPNSPTRSRRWHRIPTLARGWVRTRAGSRRSSSTETTRPTG